MRIVVDTNIVFSAMLNTQSRIGQILISGSKYFEFYSINLLKEEIKNHQDKILKISGYSPSQYEAIYYEIISRVTFVDEVFLSDAEISSALGLTHNIDENDTLFVALANQLQSKLWTGDKKLAFGLQAKGYDNLITTKNIYGIFLENQYNSKK